MQSHICPQIADVRRGERKRAQYRLRLMSAQITKNTSPTLFNENTVIFTYLATLTTRFSLAHSHYSLLLVYKHPFEWRISLHGQHLRFTSHSVPLIGQCISHLTIQRPCSTHDEIQSLLFSIGCKPFKISRKLNKEKQQKVMEQ